MFGAISLYGFIIKMRLPGVNKLSHFNSYFCFNKVITASANHH